MAGIIRIAIEFIEGDIVTGEEFVATMYLTVHTLCHSLEELGLRHILQFPNPGIYRSSSTVHHPTLIPQDTGLHIVKVVLTRLLKGRVITFLLELLRLEVIARVKLIADGQRHNVQFLKITAHSQHLKYCILSSVIRVLSPTLALGNPYILLLLGNSIMDITAHQL